MSFPHAGDPGKIAVRRTVALRFGLAGVTTSLLSAVIEALSSSSANPPGREVTSSTLGDLSALGFIPDAILFLGLE